VLAHQTGDLREGSPGERVLQREHRLRVTTRQLGEDRRRPCRRGPGVAPRSDWRSGARPRAARKQHLADRLGARMRVRNGDAAAIFAKPGTSAPERGRWRIMARSYGRACSAPPGRWIAHPPAASTLERCEGLRSISCPGPCWFHTPGWLPRRCGRDDRRRERRRWWPGLAPGRTVLLASAPLWPRTFSEHPSEMLYGGRPRFDSQEASRWPTTHRTTST
jgi:hypothetical protein